MSRAATKAAWVSGFCSAGAHTRCKGGLTDGSLACSCKCGHDRSATRVLAAARAPFDLRPVELEAEQLSVEQDSFDDLSCVDLADLFSRLTHLVAHLGEVRDEVERAVLDLWEDQEFIETAGGPIKRSWQAKRYRAWDNEGFAYALTQAILREATVDENGEQTGDLDTARKVLGIVGRVMQISGSNVRTKQLGSVGLDADEWAESVAGRYRANLIR